MNVLRVDFKAEDAAKQFAKSLRETGFGVITNHTISKALVQEVYAGWDKFYNLSKQDKMVYLFDANKNSQDGYFPDGEVAKGEKIADIKEFFHIYPNCALPDFLKEPTEKLRAELFAMAKTLLGWLEAELPKEIADQLDCSLTDMISNDRTLLRTIYYPAFDGMEPSGAVRAAAHGDINLITLIPAASADGLQVQDTNGNWIDVPCGEFGNISINAGDMLDMATQGYFPATIHRVINPEGDKKSEARMSLPLFCHPRADVRLKPDFTAGDYLEERLAELGLKKAISE